MITLKGKSSSVRDGANSHHILIKWWFLMIKIQNYDFRSFITFCLKFPISPRTPTFNERVRPRCPVTWRREESTSKTRVKPALSKFKASHPNPRRPESLAHPLRWAEEGGLAEALRWVFIRLSSSFPVRLSRRKEECVGPWRRRRLWWGHDWHHRRRKSTFDNFCKKNSLSTWRPMWKLGGKKRRSRRVSWCKSTLQRWRSSTMSPTWLTSTRPLCSGISSRDMSASWSM